jgi:hypothetical protein
MSSSRVREANGRFPRCAIHNRRSTVNKRCLDCHKANVKRYRLKHKMAIKARQQVKRKVRTAFATWARGQHL